MRLKKRTPYGQIVLHIFFIVTCMCYIILLIMLVSISLEGSRDATFSLFPKELSFKAYETAFYSGERILRAYGVTIFYSIVGVLLSLIVMAMFAYALSRPNLIGRRVVNFLLFFTLLFSGGLVPCYIINSSLLHLNNKIWIYIIPSLMSAWNVIVIRTYFKSLPQELFESARLDGASELRVCFQICVPLSTPVLASVGFLRFVDAWNDWSTSQIYIRDIDLYSLQYMLKQLLDSAEYLKEMVARGQMSANMLGTLANLESLRFAMAVVAAGPALLVFPFFQKYFAKGMVVGSVKG